jgi:hypothetical protein
MGQTGMFPDAQSQLLGSMHGLLDILQVVAIILGAMFFMASIMNMMRGQQIDIAQIISSFLISAMIIGIGGFAPDMILKALNPNSQSTVAEQKVEKEKELSGEEKLKKLNAYRKSNYKDILLSDASVADQYLNYLKSKDLDEAALKY